MNYNSINPRNTNQVPLQDIFMKTHTFCTHCAHTPYK